jgi:RecB family exonuclease
MEPAFWIPILIFFLWLIFRKESTPVKPSSPGSGIHPTPKTEAWILGPTEVFKEEYVSFSRIKAFEKCPRMFELIYLYGFPDRSGRAAQVGSLVHEIVHLYSAGHRGGLSEQLRAHGAVEGLLDLYELALRRTNPTFTISAAEVRPYLENFVTLNAMDGFRLQAVEHESSCIIGGFKLKCVVDRLDAPSQSAPTIIDYKTGNPKYAAKRQLETYAYVLGAAKYTPHELVFQFLKDGSAHGWPYTPQMHDNAEAWLLQRIDEIQSTKAFHRKRSRLCDYCGVSEHCYRVP